MTVAAYVTMKNEAVLICRHTYFTTLFYTLQHSHHRPAVGAQTRRQDKGITMISSRFIQIRLRACNRTRWWVRRTRWTSGRQRDSVQRLDHSPVWPSCRWVSSSGGGTPGSRANCSGPMLVLALFLARALCQIMDRHLPLCLERVVSNQFQKEKFWNYKIIGEMQLFT